MIGNVPVAAEDVMVFPVDGFLQRTSSSGCDVNGWARLRAQAVEQHNQQQPSEQNQAQSPLNLDVHLSNNDTNRKFNKIKTESISIRVSLLQSGRIGLDGDLIDAQHGSKVTRLSYYF